MEPANTAACRTRKKPICLTKGVLLLWIVHLLFSTCEAGSKQQFHRPPASVIARRAGATQYAEMFDDGEVRSRHGIHKRLVGAGSAEDVDYESYQGVLGRPGLDFPVLTGIPNTNFNCRDVGNGYFADLATDCQVFHICDGGRKISFLCPNGTIFRQNDLICDWWFKVNCALSPSLYAESAEILSRSQSQAAAAAASAKNGNHHHESNLLRRSSRLQIPLPIEGTGRAAVETTAVESNNTGTVKVDSSAEKKTNGKEPNIKVSLTPTVTGRKSFQETTTRSRTGGTKLRSRQYASFEYSSQQDGSAESFDFEEFLVPRRHRPSFRARVPVRIVHPDYIDGRHIYSVNYRSSPISFRVDSDNSNNKESQEYAESASFLKARNTFSGYDYKQPIGPNRIKFDKVKTVERSRDNKAIEDFDQFPTTPTPPSSTPSSPIFSTTTSSQAGGQPNRGTVVYSMSTTTASSFDDGKYTTQAPIDVRTVSGKLTTARRLETSRTTPFYTPTIPTIATRFEATPSTSQRPAIVFTQPPVIVSSTTTTTASPPAITTTPLSLEKNPINVSEHAIEMMKTLQELELASSSSTSATPNDGEAGSRFGLNIPPSSGPDALHSLAVYFASAMENATNSKPAVGESSSDKNKTEEPISAQILDDNAKIRSAQLSDKTVEGYEKLFQTTVTEPSSTAAADTDIDQRFGAIADQEKNDLDLQQSRNPIYAAAGQPQIRELAQLFTQALSAYLHDPEGFRKILSDIRPKDPTSAEVSDILSNRVGRNKNLNDNAVETLSTATPFVTTDRLELLDFSDVTLTNRLKATQVTNELPSISSTTESFITTTFLPLIQKSAYKNNLALDVKKTPASDLISDNSLKGNIEPFYESDADVMASTTTLAPQTTTTPDENNELALEINGGLSSMSTTFPYLGEGSQEDDRNTDQLKIFSRIEDGSEAAAGSTTETPEPTTTISPADFQTTGNPFSGQSVTLSTLLTPPSQKPPTTEILPPRYTTEESSEQLQHAQSQSFVTSNQNYLSGDEKPQRRGKLVEQSTVSYEFVTQPSTEAPRREVVNTTTTPGSPRGHYITKSIPSSLLTTTTDSPVTTSPEDTKTSVYPDTGRISPNPWSSLAYTVFLDPLTINDGLMESKESESTNRPSQRNTTPYEATTESSSTRFGLRASFREDSSTDRDIDVVETTERMQQRATEMFGGLNETSVNHLMNVMKKADSNQKVRRLILLLIQTCDDDYDKTVEESRKALLDALIGMDNNEIDETKVQIINGRNGRKINLSNVNNAINAQQSSTTQDVPITTYRGSQKLIVPPPSVETKIAIPKTTTTTTTTTPSPATYIPTSTVNPTTYFAGTSTTHVPKLNNRMRPSKHQLNDEILSEETLSTFAEFGKRTTPLGTFTTAYPPVSYTTELPEAQPTTFFPVFSRSRQRVQETTLQPIIVETTTPPPPPPTTTTTTTSTTTTTTTTPAPRTTTTTRRAPTTTKTTKRVPITTTTAAPRGRIGKSVESSLGQPGGEVKHSDERALDLLKSLYSLAAKWGRR